MHITLHALLLALLFLLTWSSPATAHPHVLRAGREAEILALFAPYQLGSPILTGVSLWNVAIQRKKIEIELRMASGATATVWLLHPEDTSATEGALRSKHFSGVIRSAEEPEARAAAAALLAAVQRNDQSSLWEAPGVQRQGGAGLPRIKALVTEWRQFDGLLVLAALALLSAMLAARHLAGGPRWQAALLLGLTAAGLAVRLAVAPVSLLGAWPWSRVWPSVSSVANGATLEWLAQRHGQFDLTDVTSWTHLAYATLMPAVLFAHGAFLLKDTRMGLVAAAAITFLPQHIRFSRAEDAFIPSLVLTSLAFASLHAWLRDESRIVRGLALLALLFLLYVGYQLRPLNIAFTAVYLLAIATLHPEQAPRHRRWIASLLVVAVALVIAPGYVGNNDTTLRSLLASPTWLLSVPLVLLWPPYFVPQTPASRPRSWRSLPWDAYGSSMIPATGGWCVFCAHGCCSSWCSTASWCRRRCSLVTTCTWWFRSCCSRRWAGCGCGTGTRGRPRCAGGGRRRRGPRWRWRPGCTGPSSRIFPGWSSENTPLCWRLGGLSRTGVRCWSTRLSCRRAI
jgi:hypothetical protein